MSRSLVRRIVAASFDPEAYDPVYNAPCISISEMPSALLEINEISLQRLTLPRESVIKRPWMLGDFDSRERILDPSVVPSIVFSSSRQPRDRRMIPRCYSNVTSHADRASRRIVHPPLYALSSPSLPRVRFSDRRMSGGVAYGVKSTKQRTP